MPVYALDFRRRAANFAAYRGWMARAWTLASAGPCKLGSIPAQDIRGALGCAREALHRARYRVQL